MKKRLIAGAALAMIMSASMMAGATYALFTSESTNDITVTSGKVQILSTITDLVVKSKGVQMPASNFENGGSATIVEGNKLVLDKVTPGDEVTVKLHIENKSDVATKYRASLTCTEGYELFNALIVTGGNLEWATLEAGVSPIDTEISISLPMLETEQNELQGLKTTLLLTVQAIQGNGDVANVKTEAIAKPQASSRENQIMLENLINTNDKVTFSDNLTVLPTAPTKGLHPLVNIDHDVTIDTNGKTLSFEVVDTPIVGTPCLMAITKKANVVINGNGKFDTNHKDDGAYGINLNHPEAVLTVNGGTYLGGPTGIQVQAGTLNVTGGFFDLSDGCKASAPQYTNYEINCIDKAFKNGTAKINVTGGTFVNFDPSANPEGAGTSYVASGYTVTSEAHGEATWYTVVKA